MLIFGDVEMNTLQPDINYKISFLLITRTYPCDYNDILGDRSQQLQSVKPDVRYTLNLIKPYLGFYISQTKLLQILLKFVDIYKV